VRGDTEIGSPVKGWTCSARTKVDIFVKIHGITTDDKKAQSLMVKRYLRDEGILCVRQVSFPPDSHPRKLMIYPHT
jgi:hypothetical protein